jgi:hydroxypyruvate isomerase
MAAAQIAHWENAIMNGQDMTRRAAITVMAGVSGAVLASQHAAYGEEAGMPAQLKGRVKHSVCRWCYGKIPLEELAQAAREMDIASIDLLGQDEWPVAKQYGLTCAMANGPGGIEIGWNDPANHEKLIAESKRLLPLIAEAGLPNMIVFSGNRRGMSDGDGITNCARGLEQILPLADELGVTVVMELLNSKVDHKDYMCDHTAWGADLCKTLGSERFKLLYDIYHMQIMEGDVIRTIQDNLQYIAHFHTGGVPGRHEIDETQELYYPRIMEAICDAGYTGYVAQEFVPSKDKDPLESLRQGVMICDV